MDQLAKTALWVWAIAWADTILTGWKITSGVYNAGAKVIDTVAWNVWNIVSNMPANINAPLAVNTNAAPILGSAAPISWLATGWYSLCRI